MTDNVYEDFIESKGLTKEFKKFEEDWYKAYEAKCVDYHWDCSFMLGDADGNAEFEIEYKAEERKNWIKYLKALGENVEMIEIEEEFRPGADFFADQLLKVFKCIDDNKCEIVCRPSEASHNLSTIWVTPTKIPAINAVEWDGDDYELSDIFNEIYVEQVMPWIDAGADPATAFNYYKKLHFFNR